MSGADNSKVMKIVLVGDSGVGKSSFFIRYCDGIWIADGAASTVANDTKHKVIELEGAKRKKTTVTLQICDTAGQERFGGLTSSSFRAAQGLFICYSITDRDSFDHASGWKQEIIKYAPKDAVCCLLALKSDMEQTRLVSDREGKALADSWNVPFFEVSSKENINVNESAQTLAQKVALTKNVGPEKVNATLVNVGPRKRGCTIL